MNAAERIREALRKDSRTLADLHRLSGVHRVNLAQFKAGTREISDLRQLEPLAKALGLEIIVKPSRRK